MNLKYVFEVHKSILYFKFKCIPDFVFEIHSKYLWSPTTAIARANTITMLFLNTLSLASV